MSNFISFDGTIIRLNDILRAYINDGGTKKNPTWSVRLLYKDGNTSYNGKSEISKSAANEKEAKGILKDLHSSIERAYRDQ